MKNTARRIARKRHYSLLQYGVWLDRSGLVAAARRTLRSSDRIGLVSAVPRRNVIKFPRFGAVRKSVCETTPTSAGGTLYNEVFRRFTCVKLRAKNTSTSEKFKLILTWKCFKTTIGRASPVHSILLLQVIARWHLTDTTLLNTMRTPHMVSTAYSRTPI